MLNLRLFYDINIVKGYVKNEDNNIFSKTMFKCNI